MKKIAQLIIALAFTVSLALAIINTASTEYKVDKTRFANVVPVPPPEFPKDKKSGK